MPTSMTTAPVVDVGLALALGAGVAVHEWSGRTVGPWQRRDRVPARIFSAVMPSTCAAIGVATGVLDLRAWVPAAGAVYATQRLVWGWPTNTARESCQAFARETKALTFGESGRVSRHRSSYLLGLRMGGVVGLWALLALIPGVPGSTPVWFLAPLVGGLGGLACAAVALNDHAAWWRPAMVAWASAAWAVPLAALATNWATLCLAAAGLALATLRTAETLIAGYQPAQSNHRHANSTPEHTVRRLLHAATWAALATSTVFTVQPPGAADIASDLVFGTVLLLAATAILSSITASAAIDANEWPLSPRTTHTARRTTRTPP